jgi:hypothetical protein
LEARHGYRLFRCSIRAEDWGQGQTIADPPFHAFIIKQIKTRGFDADDPRLFNQDVLDAEAWRLAAP